MGWHAGPCEYPPHDELAWQGRFDDPRHHIEPVARFRTLYLARRRITAFRETLQDLRPDTRTRADFRSLFGIDPPPGVVASAWRHERRVGRTLLRLAPDSVVNLEDLVVRRELEEKHAPLLAAYGMRHLDVSQLRSHQRIVTQTISLELVSQGKAAILYRSNLDSEDCLAVFDTAVTPIRYGRDQTIEADDEDLVAVAANWGLEIES
ncbi:MAG: RES domain-containing protein [Solirubrobacteraceae bacterium]